MSVKKTENTDVIIAGGGIAGLTLAVLLGQQGMRVSVIDPAPPPPVSAIKPTGRTVALMQSSLNIIRACGIWKVCAPHAEALQTMRIIDISRAEPLEVEFPSSDIGLKEFGFNMPNGILRAALHEQAATMDTITLHMPDKLSAYEAEAGGVTVTLDSGAQLQAPLLIGADGRGSKVRELAGIACDTHDYGQSAITCLVNHSNAHQNISTEFHRPSGPLAFVPLPGNQSSVVWVEPHERADTIMNADKATFLTMLEDLSGKRLGGLSLEAGPQSWPLRSIKAKTLIVPRVALMAEAAHVISPITAQGLNLSLRDVAALAETITDARRLGLDTGSLAVLQDYQARRLPDINSRVFGVNSLNMIVSNDNDMIKAIRRRGLSVLDNIPALKSFAMRQGLAPPIDQGRLARGEAL